MKFGIEYETKVTVEFSKPEKIKEIFIDGDWKDVFCELEDVDEFANYVSHYLLQDLKQLDEDLGLYVSELEGVGTFVQQLDGQWIAFNTAYGEIRVKVLWMNEHQVTVQIKEV